MPVAAVPLTLAAWFRSDSITVTQLILTIGTAGTLNHRFSLTAQGAVAGDPVGAVTATTSPVSAVSSTGYAAGTWHHGCAVFASATSRAAYIDGGSKGTEATSRTPAGMDTTLIGSAPSIASFFDGQIAEAGIWDAALSDDEVAILGRAVSPLLVRPASLVAYWPILGRYSPEIDIVGGFNLSLVASPATADHPRIMLAAGSQSRRFTTAAVAGGGKPWLYYAQQRQMAM